MESKGKSLTQSHTSLSVSRSEENDGRIVSGKPEVEILKEWKDIETNRRTSRASTADWNVFNRDLKANDIIPGNELDITKKDKTEPQVNSFFSKAYGTFLTMFGLDDDIPNPNPEFDKIPWDDCNFENLTDEEEFKAEEAFEKLYLSALNKDLESAYKLGLNYMSGSHNMHINLNVARVWLSYALTISNNTHFESAYQLGILYEMGNFGTQRPNFEKAFHLYSLATDHAKCLFRLGCLYYMGRYSNSRADRPDFSKAYLKFIESAELGYMPAINNVGIMELVGLNPSHRSNIEQGISWLTKSKSAYAYFNLAIAIAHRRCPGSKEDVMKLVDKSQDMDSTFKLGGFLNTNMMKERYSITFGDGVTPAFVPAKIFLDTDVHDDDLPPLPATPHMNTTMETKIADFSNESYSSNHEEESHSESNSTVSLANADLKNKS